MLDVELLQPDAQLLRRDLAVAVRVELLERNLHCLLAAHLRHLRRQRLLDIIRHTAKKFSRLAFQIAQRASSVCAARPLELLVRGLRRAPRQPREEGGVADLARVRVGLSRAADLAPPPILLVRHVAEVWVLVDQHLLHAVQVDHVLQHMSTWSARFFGGGKRTKSHGTGI